MTSSIILVTGASKGIGKAVSIQLLQEGYHVVGLARHFDEPLLSHPRFSPVPIDLSQIKELPEAFKSLIAHYPYIRGIVCNAGKGHFGNLEEFSFDQMRSMMDLNFLSHAYLIKTYLPLLRQQERTDIIFIGSEAALNGKRKGSLYCASKFAIRGFAQALREECSTSSVRVCLINPGMVQTDFFQNLSFRPGSEPSEHILPEDIAHTVSFVLKSRYGTTFDEINVSPHKKRIHFSNKNNQKPD
jgi:3-hydroxy acid dehydrogenase / malonic semialdehyde reductase